MTPIILTLLFVTLVSSEWVEISQQHYRKPLRTYSVFTTPDKVMDVEETTKPWSYNNRSVVEYDWEKNPIRAPNIGNVQRVQIVASTMTPTKRVELQDENPNLDIDVIDYEIKAIDEIKPTKATMEFNEHGNLKGMIARVPNIGNVKRVELNNSPVKSPTFNFNREKDKSFNNRYKNGPHGDDLQTEINKFEYNKNPEIYNRRMYVNKIRNHISTKITSTFPPEYEESSLEDEVTPFNTKGSKLDYKNYTFVRNLYSTKPTFITETESSNKLYDSQEIIFHKITDAIPSIVTENYNMETEQEILKTNDKKNTTQAAEKNKIKVNENANNFGIEPLDSKIVSNKNEIQAIPIGISKTNTDGNSTTPDQDTETKNQHQKEKNKVSKDTKEKTSNGTETVSNKVNTMENMMKLMKIITETISKNSIKSFGGKVQYLNELKASILTNIKDRIDSTWPDDDITGTHRHSRSAHATPRGHVHLPSSESALMTISFLTFAVFLIKLVLQVIQTYKNKTMMVAPLVVASAGRNVFTHHGHH